MSFWNQANAEPTRKYRFRVMSPDSKIWKDHWWWAKSVEKPSYEVNTTEYRLTNHKFKFPGILSWNDITIVVVDSGDITAQLMENLSFTYQNPEKGYLKTQFAKKAKEAVNKFEIQQLNSQGKKIETWELHGAFIKSVDFGSLDYSDDELVQISIGLSYDYATLE
tara:strand:+ start:779 stop:1273 length:495 start_codon:yes stop_codon:yes gene_type:complete